MRRAWLTPSVQAASAKTCRLFRIPDDKEWIGAFMGAIAALCDPDNWELYGIVTPDEAAETFTEVYEDCIINGMDRCMIGAIIGYATTNPPPNCLECDGAIYTQAAYPELYSLLDSTFHMSGNRFYVPDLRGKVMIGADFGIIGPNIVGASGGERTHTLTISELALHNHPDTGHIHADSAAAPTLIAIGAGVPAPSAVPIGVVTGASAAAITPAGGNVPHNNMQPYLVLRYAIIAR